MITDVVESPFVDVYPLQLVLNYGLFLKVMKY